ncbi:MAG: NADH-quinone oxidoreductase subunit M [Acidobacteriaceae bacterium]
MLNTSILTLIAFVPTLGALVVLLLPRRGRVIPAFALLTTLVTFVLSLHLPAHYDYSQRGFQFVVNVPWIAHPDIHYHLGIDGLSLWLILLTTFLGPIGVLVSWRAIEHRTKEFYSLFLLQQTAMIGIFVALDLFLYYAFWELSLVPMAILIAMFGRRRGPRAALKFFVYTFLPSALLLVAIIWLYAQTGTFDFVQLQARLASGGFASSALWWASLAFLVAFAVKVPVFPLHGWLADVIEEAPTAMAMVVAGKLGLYSLFRFNLGLFPAQAREMAPLLFALGVIGLLYGAMVALAQTDVRRVVAYAILSNLSFCVIGIFCFSLSGLNGAVYQTINEGLSGGALLVLIAFLYERYGSFDMTQYGGLAARLPMLATLWILTTLALIGLPILNGFVGEFLVLSGSFPVHPGWIAVATIGVILSAGYMLWMAQRIFYGQQSSLVSERPHLDLGAREQLALWPMAILMVVMGLFSPYWMKAINPAMSGLANPPAAQVIAPGAATSASAPSPQGGAR